MSVGKEFIKGMVRENPVFRLLLGLCPVLATSSSVMNAIGMGVSVIFVLVASNTLVSLLRNFIPPKIRIPIYISIIATFVTVVDLIMAGFFPDLHKSLGMFIKLIVVNCIILGRAEAFASKNNTFYAIIDGLGMGIGFTFSMIIIATIRELLGNGTWLNMPVFGTQFEPVLIFVLAPGAFITLGFIIGGMNWLDHRRAAIATKS
ncbi:electron transport complex subunit E [candidate division KSB1 bacterium]|nr:electron transport complex subunit E [candidate division KSB1 bacterium]